MKEQPKKSALLEIGVEELPARFITPALRQLALEMKQALTHAGLGFQNIDVYGSPRRLATLITGLDAKANDTRDVVIGPPPQAAKDQNGEWTHVALGFAKAQKIRVEKLIAQNTPKGERLVAIHEIKGQKTEALLKTIFPTVIQKLSFPKTMTWESSKFRFARPIRWIVALYGSQVIRFQLAQVTSDRHTLGLLSLGGQRIAIPKPERYKSLLQSRCILVDHRVRHDSIQRQLESIAKRVKATAVIDPMHVDEVIHLTEYPVGILGEFKESYLSLPREILVSVLRKHQKFFPIETSKGKLTPYFIGFRNGTSEHQEVVREGYERVLSARLADAQFFYEHDSKTPLETLAPKLAGVGLHAKLGTLWDKTERVQKGVAAIGAQLSLDATVIEHAKRTALLAKADLLTQIVGEFPELQGIAGRFYAETSEPSNVATAIEQHYWPLTSDGKLPTIPEAALVAMADKLDTLVSHFAIGLAPTGSADPYALRRSAMGVIRILLDQKWDIPLTSLLKAAHAQLPSTLTDNASTLKSLEDFFAQRCTNWFENLGYRFDEVAAVLALEKQSLFLIEQKLKSLTAIRGKPEFDALSAAIKRANNILKQARERGYSFDGNPINSNVLLEAAEGTLAQALDQVRPRLASALAEQRFEEALLELSPLKQPVDDFFNGVMVMVDDEKLRSQRLNLLMSVKNLFDTVADFSKLQAQGPAKTAP